MSDNGERGAAPEDCVVDTDSEHDDSWSPHDEMQDQFQPGPIRKIVATDGMPAQYTDATQSDIPPLSLETLVCMGDFSAFVERDDFGRETSRHEPTQVERMPNGEWWAKQAGQDIQVEPIRPPCRNYARQLTQLALNPQHKEMLRVCTARRDTGGAFMSVANLAMWGCDLREPRHVPTEDEMDKFDAKKIHQGANRELLNMFEGFGIFDQKKQE
jgi:hypothetical protein